MLECRFIGASIYRKKTLLRDLHAGVGKRASGGSRGAAMQAAASTGDPRLTAYPSHIRECYYAIQNNKDKFNVVPVGPLGMHVSLDDADKDW